MRRINIWSVVVLGGVLLLSRLAAGAQPAAPQVGPGKTFAIEFPDLPPTMANLVDHATVKPTMTVFLPTNYDAKGKYPLLVFLPGGNGGYGNDPKMARKLTDDKDFICVSMPLFKIKAEGNAPTVGRLDAADFKYQWPQHRAMLDKLSEVVPNIDPAHSVLGGFSNGAHSTVGMIEQSDGEVLARFAAFLLVEGGGKMTQYELLKDRPVLLMYGATAMGSKPQRMQGIEEGMKGVGVKFTMHEMKETGHAFPEGEYPLVREWLHNVVMKTEVKMKGVDAKGAGEPGTH